MKIPKLLDLSHEVMTDKKSRHYRQKKCLKELQLKLKKKGKKLKEKIAGEKESKELKNLENQLKVIVAQRKKIIKTLKSL